MPDIQFHTVTEAARIKNVHPNTIRAAIYRKALPAHRTSSGWLITEESLEKYQPDLARSHRREEEK